jgi:hypothetical protein
MVEGWLELLALSIGNSVQMITLLHFYIFLTVCANTALT